MTEVTVDQHSCILGVDAAAFYNAPPELREELENMRIRGSGFTFIDIDAGLILVRKTFALSFKLFFDFPHSIVDPRKGVILMLSIVSFFSR